MNGDSFFDQHELANNRKDRRSLSFSHSRFHRRTSSSDEDDESPERGVYQNEYDDGEGDYTRDSLSEFDRIKINDQDGRTHRFDSNDDFSAITRKRTFSSSDPTSGDADNANGKPASEKRAATKICRVCGDKAYSYNFSVVTCESCKAFFRRNANKDKDIRCPFSDNCEINIVSRRFCQKCRLAKCFRVGMKKEWIMSEEARREKKQRIQDNRERRQLERAQEEKMVQQKQLGQSSIGLSVESAPTQVISNNIHMTPPSDSTIVQPQLAASMVQSNNIAPLQQLNSSILPQMPLPQSVPTISTIVSMPPVQSIVQPTLVSQTEPTNVMQQVIQQAQQVQNAQLLAHVAMQNQSDQIASIQQAQLSSIGTTAVPSGATTSVVPSVAANLMAQVAMQAGPIASMQQAAQIAIGTTSVPSPTTNASIVSLNNLVQAASQIQQKVQFEQLQQNINANIAAQRIQASQNLAEQQKLASCVAVANAISNQSPIVGQTADPIPPSIAPMLPSIIPPTMPTASLTSVQLAPLVEQPVIQNVLPPSNSNNEMIAVRKDVLMNIVQENIENRHAQLQQQVNTPPAKCKCMCSCGRYPNDSVIVDRVMSDMLQEAKHSITPPVMPNHVESMDYSRNDNDCCLLTDDDKMHLNELEQADKVFWSTEQSVTDMNPSDVALRKMIRMFSSLNSFNKFSRNDQSNLLRHGCPSHLVLRQIMMGNINENQHNVMVNQFFSSLREELRSNRQLMLLLSVLVVFDSDTPNIVDKAQIIQICTRLKSILKRMLFTCYLDAQKTIHEYDDIINKLNVLQSLNNNPMQQNQNGIDCHSFWSSEVLEPLLSRELFEPNLMIAASHSINTISSMT